MKKAHKMNFHVAKTQTTPQASRTKTTPKVSAAKASTSAPFIKEDPKVRSEAQWVAYETTAKEVKELPGRLAKYLQRSAVERFPRLAELLWKHQRCRLEWYRSITVEDDLHEPGSLNSPFFEREVAARAAILRETWSSSERAIVRGYFDLIGSRDDEWMVDDEVKQALVEMALGPKGARVVDEDDIGPGSLVYMKAPSEGNMSEIEGYWMVVARHGRKITTRDGVADVGDIADWLRGVRLDVATERLAPEDDDSTVVRLGNELREVFCEERALWSAVRAARRVLDIHIEQAGLSRGGTIPDMEGDAVRALRGYPAWAAALSRHTPVGNRICLLVVALLKSEPTTIRGLAARLLALYCDEVQEHDQDPDDRQPKLLREVANLAEKLADRHGIATVTELADLEFEPWEGRAEDDDCVPTDGEFHNPIAPRLRMGVIVMHKSKDELVKVASGMAQARDPDGKDESMAVRFHSDLRYGLDFAQGMAALMESAEMRWMSAMAVAAGAATPRSKSH